MTSSSNSIPDYVTTRDGLKLAIQHWPLPKGQIPKGAVLIVHGLGEHIGRYDHVAQYLNRAGWAVVGYDQRGHGRSEGARGAIKKHDDLLCDLASVMDNLKTVYPNERLALLGHSLGGLIAARFTAALANPVENVAWCRPIELCLLSSPALKIPLTGMQKILLQTVGRLTPNLAMSNGLNPNWISTDPMVVQAYRDDPLVHDRVTGRLTNFMLDSGEVIRQRASNWSIPTLLLYSGNDRCVSPSGSRELAAKLPAALIHAKAYQQMSHEIFNEQDRAEVLMELQNWLSSA
jgi:alpha-beta hydrolase superfamily lysophospholipase